MKKNTLVGVILLLSALCCACGLWRDQKDPSAIPPAEELYLSAMELYTKKSWAYAYEDFQKVRTRYPLSEWGVKAELKLADCLYYQNQYTGALTQYQEFARLHPAHEYIDYVYYQMGMCYYEQLGTIDRDQSFAFESIRQFKRLIDLFPDSLYVPSARKYIDISFRLIAGHWVYVGDFYYRTGRYPAALDRYREAVQDYFYYLDHPDHVFFMLGKTYLRLNEPDQARQQFARVMLDYSKGSYAEEAKILVEDTQAIDELDKLTFREMLEGLNPLHEYENPVDPEAERFRLKRAGE